ncbi:DUF1656 domain-containing protein [Pantoea tagorei]
MRDYFSLSCGWPPDRPGVRRSLFFPPLFKAVLLGFFFWLILHPLLRGWIYSGEIWHPTLLDLSLFVLCVAAALFLLGQG